MGPSIYQQPVASIRGGIRWRHMSIYIRATRHQEHHRFHIHTHRHCVLFSVNKKPGACQSPSLIKGRRYGSSSWHFENFFRHPIERAITRAVRTATAPQSTWYHVDDDVSEWETHFSRAGKRLLLRCPSAADSPTYIELVWHFILGRLLPERLLCFCPFHVAGITWWDVCVCEAFTNRHSSVLIAEKTLMPSIKIISAPCRINLEFGRSCLRCASVELSTTYSENQVNSMIWWQVAQLRLSSSIPCGIERLLGQRPSHQIQSVAAILRATLIAGSSWKE